MNNRKRRLGDRIDGWRLRGIAPYDTVSPYIMVDRSDATNLFEDRFPTAAADQYIKEKKEQGYKTFGMMHIFIAAYIRTISQKPYLNRFLSGQKPYARNSIQVNMAVKRTMTREETDTVIKVFFEPTDTALDVYRKMTEVLDHTFQNKATDFDDTARIINYIPGLLKKFTVHLLKTMDYFGLLPKKLLDVSPFHGSMFITNLGSLGIPPIYHHLYNFGNVPVFIAFGAKYAVNELTDDGQVEKVRYMDYKIDVDERICDGFSYATGFRLFRRYLVNPSLLDTPPKEVFEDPDIDPRPKKKKNAGEEN